MRLWTWGACKPRRAVAPGSWKRQRKRLFPGASENTQPCRHPGLRFGPRAGERVCVVPRPPPVVVPRSSPGDGCGQRRARGVRTVCSLQPSSPTSPPWHPGAACALLARRQSCGERPSCPTASFSVPTGLTVPGWMRGHMAGSTFVLGFPEAWTLGESRACVQSDPSQPTPAHRLSTEQSLRNIRRWRASVLQVSKESQTRGLSGQECRSHLDQREIK